MVRADEVDFAVGSMLEAREDIEYQPMFTYDPMLIVERRPSAGQAQTRDAQATWPPIR